MSKKKATSSEVAEKAGVSQATVSMVLNKKYNVSFSRETVEKVEQAARELGYQLPSRKNKKDSKKEKLIVVFCPTLTSPYYVLLLQGVEAVANKQGYGVFICNTQRDARLEEKYLRMMHTIQPQGIIYSCNPNPDFQQQVEQLAQTIPLVIIKKDRMREPYDRSKIERGVFRSCIKRPISVDQINELVDSVESAVFNLGEKEVESKKIGEILMDKLQQLDPVAYVRFASVYREFKDVNTFMDEIKKLLEKQQKN